MRNKRTLNMILCGLFTALIIVGAFIRIDFILPITLQSTFVVLSGMILGKRNGAVCAVMYMALGLAGLPVFAQGGGLMYIFKPSFGYILGFILGAFVTGLMTECKNKLSVGHLYCAGLLGLLCIYAVGVVYCVAVMSLYIKGGEEMDTAYLITALAAIPIDALILIPTVVIAKKIMRTVFKGESAY